MIFGFVILITALTLSVVAAFYSISGLVAIFSAAPIPIMIMGGSLEIAKVVTTVFLHNNWKRLGMAYKTYLVPAVAILMVLTSIGIFGLLSKAHSDQNLVSGDVQSKISIYDEKIKISRDNIDASRRALKQMDEAVDQVMARSTTEGGADKAVAIRRGQAKERDRLVKEIDQEQKKITSINEERAPIAAEIRKVEADVGPIRYIAALIYGDNPDANLLERAVRWVIILIVIVFDPLALCLILSANKQFEWALKGEGDWVHDKEKPVEPRGPNLLDKLRNRFKRQEEQPVDSTFVSVVEDLEPVFDRETEIPDYTDYSEGTLVATQDPVPATEPIEEPVEEKKTRWAGFGFPLLNHFAQPKEETFREGDYCSYFPQENVKEIINAPGLDASDERPGDYVKNEAPREAAPGRNRGIMTPLAVQADVADLGKASNVSFGSEYPTSPDKGDIFLRTDTLPNRLFKFNDHKWIEVDKASTDLYAYDELYIKHLVDEIAAGRYDTETLTDLERSQIEEFLNRK